MARYRCRECYLGVLLVVAPEISSTCGQTALKGMGMSKAVLVVD